MADRPSEQARPPQHTIVVVSGLARSGTSMLMGVLSAGGLEGLTDHIRTADLDNPNGYYELERVKRLPEGDQGWLAEAEGNASKSSLPCSPSSPHPILTV